jgi:hypothetical protein
MHSFVASACVLLYMLVFASHVLSKPMYLANSDIMRGGQNFMRYQIHCEQYSTHYSGRAYISKCNAGLALRKQDEVL